MKPVTLKAALRLSLAALPALLALTSPSTASAHRLWLLPSETVLSGADAWITVDAAVSNDLFEPNHRPLDPAAITLTNPDGSAGTIENAATGHLRGTFDVHLTQQGTYRIGLQNSSVFGGYILNGKRERLPRGAPADKLASLIPAGATDVTLRQNMMRNDVFVTLGSPTRTVFKTTGEGLEMDPVTHPDDLVAGEPGRFRFLIDGKPAAGIAVTVIKGGGRWLDKPVELTATTDAKGEAVIPFAHPGMYWLNAQSQDDKATVPGITQRALGYTATLEVQAP